MAETIGEIVAWLRDPKIKNPMRKTWRDVLASRIEEAWKRERTEIEAQALSIGGIVEASRHKPFAHRETPNTVHNPVSVPQMVGNAAAMREALLRCEAISCLPEIREQQCVRDMRNIIAAALSAPARQCDVGTAEEKYRRWVHFCEQRLHSCHNCKCNSPVGCTFKFGDMPYTKEVVEA